jgi:outer membrane immunogenic protein
MKSVLFACVASVCAAPSFAQAADPVSWTGAYFGARAGYSFQPRDGDERLNFDTDRNGSFNDTVRATAGGNAFSPGFCGGSARTTAPAGGCSKDQDSLDLGLHAGYDFDLGGLVVGALGEVGYGFAEDSVTGYSTTPAYYTMTRQMQENAGVRVRAGYAFGPERKTLAYATGGVMWAKMKNSFRSSNTGNGYRLYGDDHVFGYRVGGGLEHRVARHLSVGLLYLRSSVKDDGARVDVSRGTQPATNPFVLNNTAGTIIKRSHSRFTTHNVSATVSFRL